MEFKRNLRNAALAGALGAAAGAIAVGPYVQEMTNQTPVGRAEAVLEDADAEAEAFDLVPTDDAQRVDESDMTPEAREVFEQDIRRNLGEVIVANTEGKLTYIIPTESVEQTQAAAEERVSDAREGLEKARDQASIDVSGRLKAAAAGGAAGVAGAELVMGVGGAVGKRRRRPQTGRVRTDGTFAAKPKALNPLQKMTRLPSDIEAHEDYRRGFDAPEPGIRGTRGRGRDEVIDAYPYDDDHYYDDQPPLRPRQGRGGRPAGRPQTGRQSRFVDEDERFSERTRRAPRDDVYDDDYEPTSRTMPRTGQIEGIDDAPWLTSRPGSGATRRPPNHRI